MLMTINFYDEQSTKPLGCLTGNLEKKESLKTPEWKLKHIQNTMTGCCMTAKVIFNETIARLKNVLISLH